MPSGSLALILHAHLPYLRHAQPVDEERWFFEAICESYVPILRALRRLSDEGLASHFTFSFSPTLCAMLADEVLRERFQHYLDRRCELAEIVAQHHPELGEFYLRFYQGVSRTFVDDWKCDLLQTIRDLRERGAIQLIASAATHAILSLDPEIARVQIALGCDAFRENFGEEPVGFWLPECAYTPGLEKQLADQNIRWFGLETHALDRARPRARRGPFAPVFTPSGPAAFAREARASRQIWDAHHGYPGYPADREFHADAGYELSDFPEDERDKFSGLKLRRITGRETPKELYAPGAAEEIARAHAAHFVGQQLAQISAVAAADCENIIFIPFDAELFGHWWFEGPSFLEALVRAAAANQLSLTTPTEFLARNPTQQIAQPAASSWGDGGFLDVWLDEKCAWLYPPLHAAQNKMSELANRFRHCASAPETSTLREMSRELLLAEASDWPFLIRAGISQEYATRRIREHLLRFHQLAQNLDRTIPSTIETASPSLFPNLNWKIFCPC